MVANPKFTFHLKAGAQDDLPARAGPVLDEAERRGTLTGLLRSMDQVDALEEWVAHSPLVEVTFIVE